MAEVGMDGDRGKQEPGNWQTGAERRAISEESTQLESTYHQRMLRVHLGERLRFRMFSSMRRRPKKVKVCEREYPSYYVGTPESQDLIRAPLDLVVRVVVNGDRNGPLRLDLHD